jgi:phenylalanine ammonia-lyase
LLIYANNPQIEAARTIWDLLEGSTFATTHEDEVSIMKDQGTLRQDRYSLRTAPQFLGPQIEDLLCAFESINIECNSSASLLITTWLLCL